MPSIDLQHIDNCFGNMSVLTVSKYKKIYGSLPTINEVRCWGNGCRHVYKGRKLYPGYDSIELSLDAKIKRLRLRSRNVSVSEVINALGKAKGKVLTLGEIFGVSISGFDDQAQFVAPFFRAESCSNPLAFLPHSQIVRLAKKYVNETFMGGEFMAFHWRRGDFHKWCKQNHYIGCYRSLNAVAYCLMEKASQNNLEKIYVATNEKLSQVW